MVFVINLKTNKNFVFHSHRKHKLYDSLVCLLRIYINTPQEKNNRKQTTTLLIIK